MPSHLLKFVFDLQVSLICMKAAEIGKFFPFTMLSKRQCWKMSQILSGLVEYASTSWHSEIQKKWFIFIAPSLELHWLNPLSVIKYQIVYRHCIFDGLQPHLYLLPVVYSVLTWTPTSAVTRREVKTLFYFLCFIDCLSQSLSKGATTIDLEMMWIPTFATGVLASQSEAVTQQNNVDTKYFSSKQQCTSVPSL